MTIVNVTPPAISGTNQEGQTLTTSNGTWTSDDPLVFAYEWLRCDLAGSNCVVIPGKNGASMLLISADVGSRIRSRVTATEVPSAPDDALRFTPPGFPSYSGYQSLVIANNGSNRFQVLNDSIDYLVTIGDYSHTEGPTLIGGRNVVIKDGGRITINPSSDPDPFGLALWPRNGAKHYIEGLRIRPRTSDNQHLHDGIVIRHNATYPSNSNSRIVLQNTLVGPVSIKIGLTDSAHADIIQYQSDYPGQLWIDKFTGLSDYSGIMYSNFLIGLTDYHRANLRGVDVHPSYSFANGAAFYKGNNSSVVHLDDFWIDPWFEPLASAIFPAGTPGSDGISDFIDFADSTNIFGVIRDGVPSGGDFVTESDCGIGYISPGYI